MKRFLSLILAVTMLLSLLSIASADDLPTITIMFHGSNVSDDSAVLEKVNEYIADKVGAKLEVIWGTWGDFDDKATNALVSGDSGVDMVFTCSWSADEYNTFAKNGYFLKLDDLIAQYGADLVAAIPEALMQAATIEGADGMGVYAVNGYKDFATQNCWDVNGTLLAELGYDVDAVCAAGLDYYSDAFEEMLQKAKDAKGKDFYPLLIEPVVLERMVTHSAIITGDVAAGNVLSYYYDAEHPSNDIGSTIVNKYATEEFAKFAQRTYEYAQKGFISPSCQSTATANDYRVACQSTGEYLFGTQSYAFGYELDASGARGIDVRMVPETAAYMDCTSGQGAMVAISATSKNPERALMFLNLLNTDSKLMTMLNYGTEGFTYTTNEDGTISFTDARATYSPWTNGMGNVRILPPTQAQGLDYWDRFAAYYDAAEALPYGGFIFDSSELETESAALANVYAEYAFNLMSGAVNPDTVLPEFLSKLEAAGINDFVAAAQAQLEAYMG